MQLAEAARARALTAVNTTAGSRGRSLPPRHSRLSSHGPRDASVGESFDAEGSARPALQATVSERVASALGAPQDTENFTENSAGASAPVDAASVAPILIAAAPAVVTAAAAAAAAMDATEGASRGTNASVVASEAGVAEEARDYLVEEVSEEVTEEVTEEVAEEVTEEGNEEGIEEGNEEGNQEGNQEEGLEQVSEEASEEEATEEVSMEASNEATEGLAEEASEQVIILEATFADEGDAMQLDKDALGETQVAAALTTPASPPIQEGAYAGSDALLGARLRVHSLAMQRCAMRADDLQIRVSTRFFFRSRQ